MDEWQQKYEEEQLQRAKKREQKITTYRQQFATQTLSELIEGMITLLIQNKEIIRTRGYYCESEFKYQAYKQEINAREKKYSNSERTIY